MIRINSFGGGVQSVAALVLQAQKKIEYDYFVFSNVGKDSENPDTLDYFYKYVIPFAEKYAIPLEETCKLLFGNPITLYQELMRDNRSIRIPVRLQSGAFGRRGCTYLFKVFVIARWIRVHGHREAIIGINISTDEIHRARTPIWQDVAGIKQIKEYPLIDLNISRNDCYEIITDAGLPIPPKSSCFFCPFHNKSDWIELKANKPELFQKAVELEEFLNKKRAALGKDRVYLHQSLTPLDQAVEGQPDSREIIDFCESGYCMV